MSFVAPPRGLAGRFARIRAWCAQIVTAMAKQFGLSSHPPTSSSQPSLSDAPSSGSEQRVNGHAVDSVTLIPVMTQSVVHPSQYQEILWVTEQITCRYLLIDFTQVETLSLSFFDALATSWHRSKGLTKLGVRVCFEQWALLYRSIVPYQRLLESRGLKFMLFYGEQDYRVWYLEGRVAHDAEAVINRLCSISELSVRWPTLLDAAASLLDGCGAHRRAESLVKLSQLALDLGAEKTALRLAYEALLYYKALPPEQECRARRIMGEALLQLGQSEIGTICIKEAIDIGSRAEAWEEAAGAAYTLGLHALRCDDAPRAESYFQQALELLPREPSEILGKIHAALSLALFRQGRDLEAGTHLELSCEMRKVSASSSTTELSRSRALISYMQSARKPHTDGWPS